MKRIISMLLAVVMCISMLPTLPVSAESVDYTLDPTKDVVYNLTLDAFNTDTVASVLDGNMIKDLSYADWNAENADGEKVMDLTKTAPWRAEYVKTNAYATTNTQRVQSNLLRLDFRNKLYYDKPNDNTAESEEETGPYLAIRTYVPNAGKFNISISSLATTSSGGIADVYLAEAAPQCFLSPTRYRCARCGRCSPR